MRSIRTHYDNLKVSWDAPPEVIQMAYKALVNKYHPDRNPDCQKSLRAMQIINASYDVLRDPIKKKDHDHWIKQRLSEIDAARHHSNANVSRTQSSPQQTRPEPPPQASYPKNQQQKKEAKSDNTGGGCLVAALIGGALLVLIGYGNKSGSVLSTSSRSAALSAPVHKPTPVSFAPNYASVPAFSKPIQPLPRTGELVVKANHKVIAPFQIITNEGENYFVKLAEYGTGKDVLTVFVRGGETTTVKAPLGKYIIKYASGDKWYGYEHLFGPATEYAEADDVFDFTREISPTAANRLTELGRQLMIADSNLRQYLVTHGLPQKMVAFMFDGSDPNTNEKGIDRFDNSWWNTNILSHVKNDARTYNAIVDRLNARSQISNEKNALRAKAESINGYTITLYKVRDGNLQTKQIDKSEF